jgi:hypothetical protein
MKDKNVIISLGNRSLFSRVLGSVFFGLTMLFSYKLFYLGESLIIINSYIEMRANLYSIMLTTILSIRFSVNQNHHFNFVEMKYRTYYFIGPFGYGSWKKLRKLDRVSTFLNATGFCEVKIWDINNNNYKIAAFDEIEDAVNYGRELATGLEIRFKERK